MNEGNGLLKTHRHKHRAQRLAGLGGVDGQGLAGEVEVLIFLGLGPFGYPLDFLDRVGLLELRPLVGEHTGVFLAAKQLEMVLNVVCVLGHGCLL